MKFKIYESDLPKLTWDQANEHCKRLGNGWRLPTSKEFCLIFKKSENGDLQLIDQEDYWCSEEEPFGDSKALAQFGCNGGFMPKSNKYFSRPVKSNS